MLFQFIISWFLRFLVELDAFFFVIFDFVVIYFMYEKVSCMAVEVFLIYSLVCVFFFEPWPLNDVFYSRLRDGYGSKKGFRRIRSLLLNIDKWICGFYCVFKCWPLPKSLWYKPWWTECTKPIFPWQLPMEDGGLISYSASCELGVWPAPWRADGSLPMGSNGWYSV